MPPPRRQRTKRKTPPGRAPQPRKVSEEHLAQRNDFIERRDNLRQALAEIIERTNQQLAELEGERKHWRREVIDPRYGMGADDEIEADGTIKRT